VLRGVAGCCRVVLQGVVVRCSVLHLSFRLLRRLVRVAGCSRVLQSVAECCRVLQSVAECCSARSDSCCVWCVLQGVEGCCGVLQDVARCCRVLQCAAVCYSMLLLQGNIVRCSVLQGVAAFVVCCRVLQCVAMSAQKVDRSFHSDYGVATISRLLKNIGLFCRISSLLLGSFAKETYIFKEPTNSSHPPRIAAFDTYFFIPQ